MQKSFSNGYTEYQVGNTSSCKNTEVKRHGPRLALGWVTIQKVGRGCYIYKNTVKSQKRSNGACFLAPPPQKKPPKNRFSKKRCFWLYNCYRMVQALMIMKMNETAGTQCCPAVNIWEWKPGKAGLCASIGAVSFIRSRSGYSVAAIAFGSS